jgi:DNA repair protein RecN (Recombination protein N)
VLKDLLVNNFAIIRNLEVSFQKGLNIISGETGAGKSILIGAVNLILGSRASQEMIRTAANEATVEANFSLPDMVSLDARLAELELEPGAKIHIRRGISRSGRNRIFVNEQQVTLQQLQQLTRGLISVSGQHEHQLLMDAETHLATLDNFGSLESACREVGLTYHQWADTRDQLSRLERLKREHAAQQEWMRFQVQELRTAELKPDEDRLLEQERRLLKHAGTLIEAAQNAHQALYGGRGAILEQLAAVAKHLTTLKQIDPSQEPLLAHLEQARIHLEELVHTVQQYAHGVSFDPDRLAAVEERLALLQRLGKKHGGTVAAMLQRLDELREQLSQLEEGDFQEARLGKALEELRKTYLLKARELSQQRQEVAERLSESVEQTLAVLDMPRVRFAVRFQEPGPAESTADPPFTPLGIDRVEFLLSANPGEELKPLARIASGGELSRILLALKGILGSQGDAETLIFDEVDAGIGGRTAELVGLQLKRLAASQQVVCITHLPQIACYGDYHFKVTKEAGAEETSTNIHLLSSDNREEELARMLGGISISERTRAHAREMLQGAQQRS